MVSAEAGGVLGSNVLAACPVQAVLIGAVWAPQNTEAGMVKDEFSTVVVAAESVKLTVEAGIPSVVLGEPLNPAAHQAVPPVMWTVSPPLPVVLLAASTEAFGVVPLKMTLPTFSAVPVKVATAMVHPTTPALICACVGGHAAAVLLALNVAGHTKVALKVPVALLVLLRLAAAMSAKSCADSPVPRMPASKLAGAMARLVLAGRPVQLMAMLSPGVTFGMKFWAAVPPAVVSW
jgi:hypothetical protein